MSKYFNITQAWGKVKESTGLGETAMSVAKMVAKGVSNTAVFGVTEVIPGFIKGVNEQAHQKSSDALAKDDLTDDQRARILEVNKKSKEALERIKEMEAEKMKKEEEERKKNEEEERKEKEKMEKEAKMKKEVGSK